MSSPTGLTKMGAMVMPMVTVMVMAMEVPMAIRFWSERLLYGVGGM
jgi:hypothetical protein